MGSLAAVETVKLFLGHDAGMAHRFLAYDGLRCRFVEGQRIPDPDCELCGGSSTIEQLMEVTAVSAGQCCGISSFMDRVERETIGTCVETGG
jgi:hypothetical protein